MILFCFMDTFVKEKLKEWKLDSLIPRFELEEIDKESFILLDDASIAALVPVIGPRLKLRSHLRKLTESSKDPQHELVEYSPTAGPSMDQQHEAMSSGQGELFKIREALNKTPDGRDIVCSLDTEQCLSLKQRRAMVRILVSYLIERFGETPSSETKKNMASSLVTEFPCLKDQHGNGNEAWYSPGRNHRPATGFIEERLRNVRKRLRSGTSRPSHVENNVISSLVLPETEISDERAEAMMEWLKNNIRPLSQVEEYMKQTAIHRAKWIREHGSKTMEEIKREYPRLLDTPGMIAQDFSILHPACAGKLAEKWMPVFKDKILRFASQEKQASGIISKVDSVCTDAQGDMALRLLPVILPASVYRIGRKSFRPSCEETKKSFIDLQPVGTNMVEFLSEAQGTRPYPFVLALGDDQRCSQSFVVINGEAMEQSTLIGAVDVCFKAYYVFDINYPRQCSSVWEFLQTVVYELPGQESPSVRLLRAFIFSTQ
ncbi:uncharacterized protein LOC111195806 isoform X2 [Astyanax mexicanus]|uniref:uncharacterized protein LOC111195806 isoform X2 n=2 Tax=Astyanax mexicanus TaxID=7994 RepID=UPI0020CAAD1F|nr:uncharacterized protein LOC111195806 isoform X2 [Astyanax mexicanus]